MRDMPGWRRIFILIFSGTVSRRICSGMAPICASSRKCLATQIFRQRKFTLMSINNGLRLYIDNFIRGHNNAELE